MDAVSGLWFEEQYAGVNDFGDVIDMRNRDSYDYDTDATGGPSLGSGPYYTGS